MQKSIFKFRSLERERKQGKGGGEIRNKGNLSPVRKPQSAKYGLISETWPSHHFSIYRK